MSEARIKQLEKEIHKLGHVSKKAVDERDMDTTVLIATAIQSRLRELMDLGAKTAPGGASIDSLYQEGNRLLTKFGVRDGAAH